MRLLDITSVLFLAVVSVFAGPVVQRSSLKSAAVILTDLTEQVAPLANQLLYATADNATQTNLKPIITKMGTSVTNAVSDLYLLAGQPSDVTLGSVDGTSVLNPSDIAALLGGIINLIFNAGEAVLQVVDSTIQPLIYDLLAALGKIVFILIPVLLSLVGGLLPPLLVLLAPILSIVSTLGLTSILSRILGGLL